MQFTILVQKNGQRISGCRTHKIRRFLKIMRGINFEDRQILVTLRVMYGKAVDNNGDLTIFDNEASYKFEAWESDVSTLKHKVWLAFEAFTEKGVY